MDRAINWFRDVHTKLLISLYKRYARHQSSRKRGDLLVVIEFYCKEIEARAIYTPKPKAASKLITGYLSFRFPKRMRCLIYKKGREIGRFPLDSPEDISKRDDFIEKNYCIPAGSGNTRKSEVKKIIEPAQQRTPVPWEKMKEEKQISSPSTELQFSEIRKQEYLKEKEETSVIINRIASMNTSKKDVPGEVEDYVLNQFTEANGFTADVSCINSGLREQYNIIWVESTIDKINAKYWDTLKSSLITVSEDGKYQIKKEQLDIIRHE